MSCQVYTYTQERSVTYMSHAHTQRHKNRPASAVRRKSKNSAMALPAVLRVAGCVNPWSSSTTSTAVCSFTWLVFSCMGFVHGTYIYQAGEFTERMLCPSINGGTPTMSCPIFCFAFHLGEGLEERGGGDLDGDDLQWVGGWVYLKIVVYLIIRGVVCCVLGTVSSPHSHPCTANPPPQKRSRSPSFIFHLVLQPVDDQGRAPVVREGGMRRRLGNEAVRDADRLALELSVCGYVGERGSVKIRDQPTVHRPLPPPPTPTTVPPQTPATPRFPTPAGPPRRRAPPSGCSGRSPGRAARAARPCAGAARRSARRGSRRG